MNQSVNIVLRSVCRPKFGLHFSRVASKWMTLAKNLNMFVIWENFTSVQHQWQFMINIQIPAGTDVTHSSCVPHPLLVHASTPTRNAAARYRIVPKARLHLVLPRTSGCPDFWRTQRAARVNLRRAARAGPEVRHRNSIERICMEHRPKQRHGHNLTETCPGGNLASCQK